MAKRGRKPKLAPEPKAEARSSFLPDEPKESTAEEHVTEAETEETGPVTLTITKTEDRMLEVALLLPPLKPSVEKIFLPLQCSPEQLASITASAIKRAAHSAEADGIYLHAAKQQEENEARERFERRA
jgi:hypothetical protein